MLGVKRPNDICYIIRSYEEVLEDDSISEDAKQQIEKLLKPNAKRSDEKKDDTEQKKDINEYI